MSTPFVRTALDMHPELAQKVGLVIADYALLERFMWVIYALLPGVDTKQSVPDFYSRRSIRRRQALVLETAKPALNITHYRALKRLWKRLGAAADRRTEIAHCLYAADDDKLLRLQLTDKHIHYVPLDIAVFERTFIQYHNLGTDLLIFQARLAGSLDRYRRINNASTPPPNLKIPNFPPDSQRPPTQSEIDEHTAALSRLKIPHEGYPWRHKSPRPVRRFWRRLRRRVFC